jgi:hypothetical protein
MQNKSSTFQSPLNRGNAKSVAPVAGASGKPLTSGGELGEICGLTLYEADCSRPPGIAKYGQTADAGVL